MEKEKAIKIISRLADGIDPSTGELFPSESPYQDPQVLRALYTLLMELKRSEEPCPVCQRPRNTGQKWTRGESMRLRQKFGDGMSISMLAKSHGRTTGAIAKRLKMMGLIDDGGKRIVSPVKSEGPMEEVHDTSSLSEVHHVREKPGAINWLNERWLPTRVEENIDTFEEATEAAHQIAVDQNTTARVIQVSTRNELWLTALQSEDIFDDDEVKWSVIHSIPESSVVSGLREKAEEGDFSAQFRLGVLHLEGWGVKQNYEEAYKYLCHAADQGHGWACGVIGSMFLTGRGVPEDKRKAQEWFSRGWKNGAVLNYESMSANEVEDAGEFDAVVDANFAIADDFKAYADCVSPYVCNVVDEDQDFSELQWLRDKAEMVFGKSTGFWQAKEWEAYDRGRREEEQDELYSGSGYEDGNWDPDNEKEQILEDLQSDQEDLSGSNEDGWPDNDKNPWYDDL